MDIETTLNKLFARRQHHIKVGLERMLSAYQQLQCPAAELPHVLVAGTNGKGTTAGYLWRLWAGASGRRLGLYTSPHLRVFSERIQLISHDIEDADLVKCLHALLARLDPQLASELTFFELTTLLAFQTFADLGAEGFVCEVGMGGRWDATNIGDPEAVAIVSVDLDHQRYLGNSLADIAAEKAAIMRAGVPAFIGKGIVEHLSKDPLEVISEHGQKVGCPLFLYGEDFFVGNRAGDEKCFYIRNGSEVLEFSMPKGMAALPSYQLESCVLALAILANRGYGQADLQRALFGLPSPGQPLAPGLLARTQWLEITRSDESSQQVLADVSHNPAAARQLVKSLKELQITTPVPGLMTFVNDKDINTILDVFDGILQPIVLFKNKSDRSFTDQDLADRHKHHLVCENFLEAWRVAEHNWPHSRCPWVITGSVIGLGEVFEYLMASELNIKSPSPSGGTGTDVAVCQPGPGRPT